MTRISISKTLTTSNGQKACDIGGSLMDSGTNATSYGFDGALAKLAEIIDHLSNEHSAEIALLERENLCLRQNLKDAHVRLGREENVESHKGKIGGFAHQDDVILQERNDEVILPERNDDDAYEDNAFHHKPPSPKQFPWSSTEFVKPSLSVTHMKSTSSTVGHMKSTHSIQPPHMNASSSMYSSRSSRILNQRAREDSFQIKGSKKSSSSNLEEDFTVLSDSLPSHLTDSPRHSSPNAILHFWIKDCWANHTDLATITCRQILDITGAVLSSGASETPMFYSHSENKWRSQLSQLPTKQRKCIVHPFSRKRFIWAAIGLTFLLYDFCTIPIDVCFDSGRQSIGEQILLYLALLFWTCDIPFTFLTAVYVQGVLAFKPSIIAGVYMRSWLLVDLFLVSIEWAVIVFESVAYEANAVTVIRGVRWIRMIRIMRLMKLVRLTRLKPILFEIIHHSSEDFKVFLRLTSWTIGVFALAHVFACLWYLLGSSVDNGWVQTSGISGTVFQRYVISLRYVFTRIHGADTWIHARTTLEIIVDIFWIFFCIVAIAFYTASATHAVICWAHSDSAQLKKLAGNFIQRHKISRRCETRTRNFLSACRIQGMGEMLQDERRFLKMLPVPLQEDLQCEARAPILSATAFFRDLYDVNPRVMRHVCYHAISEGLAVQEEIVFAPGDACRNAIFILEGELQYRCRSIPQTVLRKQCLSEATLWTHWEHTGTLKAIHDTLILALNAEKFNEGIIPHKLACAHAVKYARVFVKRLNHIVSSDLTTFDDLDLESLDSTSIDFGNEEKHLIFLSHFKAEAGTEATLMRDALEQILNTDPSYSVDCLSPVFVDSEDLVDLNRLKAHVEGSSALVLLLTPGLLTRPWCLLEIMTAFQCDKRIVPVEVQRPGIKYQYPDEDFFRKFEEGLLLSADDKKLLEDNGGSDMKELAKSVRHVFTRIALPFSPHKSFNIRHAELSDILKRCGIVGTSGTYSRAPDAASRLSVMTVETRRTLDRSKNLFLSQ